MKKNSFLCFLGLFSFLTALCANSPQKDSFSKIQSIESDKQLILNMNSDSDDAKANELRQKTRNSLKELEETDYITDSGESDFNFSLSEPADSFTFNFYFGGKLLYGGKGSVPKELGKICEKAEFSYTVTADSDSDSCYIITPRSVRLLSKDGKTVYQKSISGRSLRYQYKPETRFSWNDEKIVKKSAKSSAPREKGVVRGADIMLPVTFFAENGKGHSYGMDFSLDLHFRPYLFFGGNLGFAFEKGSDFAFLSDIFLGCLGIAGGITAPKGGKVYGTATVRAGAFFPLTPSPESYLPAFTVQPFVEAGSVNSRAGLGYGLIAALHSNPDTHAGCGGGLFVSYSYFKTKGGGYLHKGAVGFYFKYDDYKR